MIGRGHMVFRRTGHVVMATVGERQHRLVVRCLPRRPTTRDGGINLVSFSSSTSGR